MGRWAPGHLGETTAATATQVVTAAQPKEPAPLHRWNHELTSGKQSPRHIPWGDLPRVTLCPSLELLTGDPRNPLRFHLLLYKKARGAGTKSLHLRVSSLCAGSAGDSQPSPQVFPVPQGCAKFSDRPPCSWGGRGWGGCPLAPCFSTLSQCTQTKRKTSTELNKIIVLLPWEQGKVASEGDI